MLSLRPRGTRDAGRTAARQAVVLLTIVPATGILEFVSLAWWAAQSSRPRERRPADRQVDANPHRAGGSRLLRSCVGRYGHRYEDEQHAQLDSARRDLGRAG